jgi:hypothetical protein
MARVTLSYKSIIRALGRRRPLCHIKNEAPTPMCEGDTFYKTLTTQVVGPAHRGWASSARATVGDVGRRPVKLSLPKPHLAPGALMPQCNYVSSSWMFCRTPKTCKRAKARLSSLCWRLSRVRKTEGCVIDGAHRRPWVVEGNLPWDPWRRSLNDGHMSVVYCPDPEMFINNERL